MSAISPFQMRPLLLHGLATLAYEHRDPPFTLKSGKTSNHYVDCRRVLVRPTYREWAGQLITSICVVRGLFPDYIAGVALGGVPLADSVSSLMDIDACYVRPEPKEHGKENNQIVCIGKRGTVVLLEDVVTTGGSSIKAIHALQEYGLKPVHVIALVDRQEGGLDHIRANTDIPAEAVFTLDQIINDRKK